MKLEPAQRLPFAQYPPSHFTPEEWDQIWDRPVINLDPYLITTEYLGGILPTVFHHELEFVGYAYRVKIDAEWVKISAGWNDKISFTRGTTVNICNINDSYGRYTTEYCQLIRDGTAYLPVHFREYCDQGFSTTNDPRHHSFILAIPVELSHSPFLPHLQSSLTNTTASDNLACENNSQLKGGRGIFNFKFPLCC